jgi:ATP-dependent Clp protease ATP-binding subunit ClpC
MTKVESMRPGAKLLWENVLDAPSRFGHGKIGLNHFLYILLERYGEMAESMASGLISHDYRLKLEKYLKNDKIGEEIHPSTLLDEVLEHALKAGKKKVSERDMAAVILKRDGWNLIEQPKSSFSKLDTSPKEKKENNKADSKTVSTAYRPRVHHPTPMLEKFGRDLCQEALNGKLPRILGREMEMEVMMETLCRWTKRNPLLIGPAGVGKTAIVEGLAQRVVQGKIPEAIQGIRIFALQASTLVSGASVVGKLEERMQAILKEASQDGIVLFIDEVHSIVGSGGKQQVSDVGSQLKPALSKGEIAVIGATTNAEFHQFIEEDRALERRFQPLRVNELSKAATLRILHALNEKAQKERNVIFSPETLERIILLAQHYLRNRNFPDKAIDILEQCTAHATLNEIKNVTPVIVQNVLERMIGMPVDMGSHLEQRLNNVKDKLEQDAFCPEKIAEQISDRLAVTARGLDVNPACPNAVLLSIGTSGQQPELAAQVLAKALYGNRDRLIKVDMTRFSDKSDVNWLLGAPPGYIGHDRTIRFHKEIAQQPWSVILFQNIEASHPQVQEILAQAFNSGNFSNAHEQKVYLSDTTVILTITTQEKAGNNLGFITYDEQTQNHTDYTSPDIRSFLIPELIAELDAWWSPIPFSKEYLKTWVSRWLLPPLTKRYQRRGITMIWKESVIDWIAEEILRSDDISKGQSLLEKKALPNIIPYLDTTDKIVLSCKNGNQIHVNGKKGV